MDNKGEPALDKEKFLLQEHQELWVFVRKITDERNSWLKFYWGIITASLAALGYFLSEKPDKFWIIATLIFFALLLVSTTIYIILFSLRKKSVEYRNHLNIIRGKFLPDDDPELKRYLSKIPSQRFFKKYIPQKNEWEKNYCEGVENCILWLVAIVSSLICGASVFSFIKSWASCYCLPILFSVIALFIFGGSAWHRGHKFGDKCDDDFDNKFGDKFDKSLT